jgi:regulator of protease activity HflC (stomatin/prohibitin superfamily)
MLSELARFNAARRFGLPLFALGMVLAIFGLGFVEAAASQSPIPGIALPRALAYAGAALWLAAAGFISASLMAFARQKCVAGETQRKNLPPGGAPRSSSATSKFQRSWQSVVQLATPLTNPRDWSAEKMTEWPLTIIPLAFAGVAALTVVSAWRQPPTVAPPDMTLKLLSGGLIVTAFPLLLLQRTYANFSAELLPEAPQLERLIRVPLAACIGIAISMILTSAGFPWAVQIERLVAAIVFIVALELIVRSLVTLFVPFESIDKRRAVADSSIAGFLLRLTPPSVRSLNIAVRRQFGVDLSRSWALAFVQRAALPIAAAIGVFAWLVTGVTALPLNQRGVYQRLGVPVAVFGPGLHIHLPWPLGIVTTTEIGVVHQLPIEFVLPNGNGQVVPEEKDVIVNAEAIPPPGADRLWDDAHPFEGSYLIASQENGQQSFQLTDVDMAVVYQVGLTDDAARNAAYRVTNPEELIQALSGQILVRYLSQNTLLSLLGQSRESFASQFQTELQQQLDRFNTGLQVLAISIEAIHPPPEAAAAYHDVQAAEIRAGIHVAESKGDAARAQKFAQMQATTAEAEASAAAAEVVGQAQTASTLFGGDREAYAKNGNVFLLERWFDNLNTALGKSEFIIIDHRLSGQDIPTLDLRNLAGPPRFDSGPVPAAAPAAPAPNGAQQGQPNTRPAGGPDDDDD